MAKIIQKCKGFVMIRDSDNPFSLYISYPALDNNDNETYIKQYTDIQAYRPDPRNHLEAGKKYCCKFEFGVCDKLVNGKQFPVIKNIFVDIADNNKNIKIFEKVR
jgi:hypothetical protein